MQLPRASLIALVGLAAALAACGGGGSLNAITPPATAPPTNNPLPTTAPQQPFAASTTVPAAASVSFPSAGGYSANLGFGSATIPAGTMATLTDQDTAPVSVAPMTRTRTPNDAYAGAVLSYFSVTLSNAVTAGLSLSVTIPSGVAPAGSNYWLSLNDPLRPSLGWELGFAGPASVSGSIATFAAPSYTYAANETYWFAMYAIQSSAATPSPAPSITPLPTPTPAPTGSGGPTPTPTPTAGGVVIVSGQPGGQQ